MPRTAHYYTIGTLSAQTKNIWIVAHGYGQRAEYFIQHFKCLLDQNEHTTLVVAPEGFSKFYLEGLSGRVGATWMTKHQRTDEIVDYTKYFTLLYEKLINDFYDLNTENDFPERPKINVVGFSQGAATVCRWLAASHLVPNSLTIWAGAFPEDMKNDFDQQVKNVPLFAVVGTKDPFIKLSEAQKQIDVLKQKGFDIQYLTFEGEHTLDTNTLLKIQTQLG